MSIEPNSSQGRLVILVHDPATKMLSPCIVIAAQEGEVQIEDMIVHEGECKTIVPIHDCYEFDPQLLEDYNAASVRSQCAAIAAITMFSTKARTCDALVTFNATTIGTLRKH